MSSAIVTRPLFTWEAFTVRVDLDALESWINGLLGRQGAAVRELRVAGLSESIELRARVVWEGLPSWISVRVSELRLYKGQVGCRVGAVLGPFGVPVPVALVAALIRRLAGRLLHLDAHDRILVVDLRAWLPPWLDLYVRDTRCAGRWLELGLASGAVASWATRASALSEEPEE